MSAATRRHRGLQLETEDSTDLKLGDDFSGQHAEVYFLSQAEAAILLDKNVLNPENPELRAEREALPENPIHKKTATYLEQFSRLKDAETVIDLRQTLEHETEGEQSLHPFEIMQLVNFCPETVEEAKSLIPSLQNRSDDERLQGLLNEIATRRAFTQ